MDKDSTIEREKLERMMLLLAVATFHTPALQAERTELVEAGLKALAAPVQPVAWLANGTRFKISYDSRQSGGQINGIPPELGGRWVAFVAADDDCHLTLTTPTAAQRPWVGLTDEDKLHIEMIGGKSDVMLAEMVEAKLKERNV